MKFVEILKVLLFGLVEGYTEFLPISSTGHLILVENLIHLDQPEEFFSVFKMVIQVGAMLAVVVLYWDRLWPFDPKKKQGERNRIWRLWITVAIGCIPAFIFGILLDDLVEAYLSTPFVIGITLIAYGIAFLLVEKIFVKKHPPKILLAEKIDPGTALLIGIFQCLAIIPGTSRSGATIIGALCLGVGRSAAAEFSFFLGIPVVAGSALLKCVKAGFDFTGEQWLILVLGVVISFGVALVVVRGLIGYLRKHDFTVFGWYRIILGIIVLVSFGLYL